MNQNKDKMNLNFVLWCAVVVSFVFVFLISHRENVFVLHGNQILGAPFLGRGSIN